MNRIKELRRAGNYRQSDIARGTHIDQKTLSNYETGKTHPDSKSIIAIAKFFNVSTDYLLGVSDYNLQDTEALVKEIEDIQRKLSHVKSALIKAQQS